LVMEILPEPLFMWGTDAVFEGDFIGHIVGLWNGTLGHAEPTDHPKPQQPEQRRPQENQQRQDDNPFKNQFRPDTFRPSGKSKQHKHQGHDRRSFLEQNRGGNLSSDTQPKIIFKKHDDE